MALEPELRDVPAQPVAFAGGRGAQAEIGDHLGPALGQVMGALRAACEQPRGMPFARGTD